MRQVRLAIGSEALIVSNRRVNGGVEIMATDPTVAPSDADAAAPAMAWDAAHEPKPEPRPRPGSAAAAPAADVMGAIGDLRGSLETRIDELLWGSQLRRAPQAVSLFQTLMGLGFSTALLRAMLKHLPEHLSAKAAMQWVRHELTAHLPTLAQEDDLWIPGRVLALVGPTGVGKTTTIAKLAARCIKRQGAGKIVLLTTDTYRIGAHEQLKIYGQMMRAPVHIVQDADELKRVVGGISPDQTILIDNVGTSQRDRYIVEQAAMLAGAGRRVQRLLVLNASSHGDTLDEVARSYCNDGGDPISGCIITKLDEASRMGAALDTAIRYQLPVHYVSNGQKVPENLLFLSARELADQALAPRPRARALYAPTQADLAAMMSLAKTPEAAPADAVKGERRRQLLPQLLALTSAGLGVAAGAAPTQAHVKAACDYLENDLACSEALDLWRSHTGAAKTAASVQSLIDQQWASVHNHLARVEGAYVLAVHDRVGLASPDGPASLRATMLLTDRAVALGTPMQSLARAEGWLSSSGESALVAPGPSVAVFRQVDEFARRASGLPCVHLLEGGNSHLWRRLSAQQWLAHVSGATKISTATGPTTAGALAKTLVYQPVARASQWLSLTRISGLAIEDLALWIGAQAVELPARGKTGVLALHMLAVRIVDRHSGAIIQTHCGLSNLSPEQIETGRQGAWLIAQTESKAGFRYAARGWHLLGSGDRPESAHALLAMQLGLATWRIMQAPDAESVRTMVSGLGGAASLASTVSGVLKLFALREIIA